MKDIYTQRLVLRPFCEDDRDAIFHIFNDKETNAFLPWFPLSSKEEAFQFYQEHYQNKPFHYAICFKENNIPIGYIHLSDDDSHDFGYGLHRAYWHQGIMSEACLAAIEEFKAIGIPYITATHDQNNPYSGEVMKKLGMQYQYSYEELWQPKNIKVVFRMYQLNFNKEHFVYKKYWHMYPHFIEKIFEYKEIQMDDLKEIVPSYIESFNSEPWNDHWSEQTAYQRLSMMLSSPVAYGICAYSQNQFYGAVIGEKEQYDDGLIYRIKEFWIDNQLRGKGIGTQIYHDLQARLLRQEIIRIELDTIRNHNAEGFYRKIGFEEKKDIISMSKNIGK